MFYLILGILASSMVSIVMRLTKTRVKNETSLLAVNYVTCILIAGTYMGFDRAVTNEPGFVTAMALGLGTGILYLAGFLLLQWNVGKNGVVLSSTFMKLGLLVPIAFSLLFFGETPTALQAAGFVLAVAAVLMMNSGEKTVSRARWALVLLLLSCGTGDAMSKVYEYLGRAEMSDQFLFYTFVSAFVLCLLLVIRKREKPGAKELFWGAMLGLPNYFSARFILAALQDLPAVIVYPTFSVASMVVLTLTGVCFFKEKLRQREWLAIGVILVSLVLLNV